MADEEDTNSAKLVMLQNTTPLRSSVGNLKLNSDEVIQIEDLEKNRMNSNNNYVLNDVEFRPNDVSYTEDEDIKFDNRMNIRENDIASNKNEQNNYEILNMNDIKSEPTKVYEELNTNNLEKDINHKGRLTEVRGSTISFHNLHYNVKVKAPGKKCCAQIDKEIISDVTGVFYPGMNGILGPTGGGKSSLLDILAGRKNKEGLSGIVLVDGMPQPLDFKCTTGYVVQDDVVMGTLSVKENFMFSANLRIKKNVSMEEKLRRVDETVLELGLSKCANTKVGTEFIRGISGGERKRTNIGMELIIQPKVLFLDEPTTGLDASTANAVMTLLYRLSLRGRTIIFSIHQPRYSIFKLFNRLMLLGDGKTIYHGPAQETLDYFKTIGYECETYNNPPDFFLDVINGDSTAVTSLNLKHTQKDIYENGKTDKDDLLVDSMNGTLGINNHNDHNGQNHRISSKVEGNTPLTTHLAILFKNSICNQKIMDETKPILNSYEANKSDKFKLFEYLKGESYSTSFFTQLYYLSKRCLVNLVRNPQATFSQIIVTTFFAIIVGLIFLQLNNMKELPVAIQNRVGALFFVIMNQTFSNLPAIELFIKERSIFIHENASGFYRVSVYFVAKIFSDLIPMRIIPVTVFSIITYFMIGFEYTAHQFFIYYACLFLVCLTASAIGFAISSSVRMFSVASLLISFTFVIMMVFGGFLANVKYMGDWLNWLQYLSIVRYALNIQLINQMKDLTLYVNGTIPIQNAGNEYLKDLGIAYETSWDMGKNFLALIIMMLILMTICYIQLRRIPKYK